MKFFVATTFVAIASVSAAPTYLNPVTRAKCDVAACGIALAPTGVGCVSAAVKLGADPFADASCAAGVANLGANTPASCQPCVTSIKAKLPEAVDDVKEAVKGAVDDVKSGISSLFSRDTCDTAKCGIAAAPTGIGCVSAAVKLGADPFSDAGCVTGLLNLGVNTPAVCTPCLNAAKKKVPQAFEKVKDTVTSAVDDVKEGISDLFSREGTCDAAKCGIAAAPTGVGCVSAAVKLGADPFADAGCVAGLLNLGVNTPDVCSACLDAAKSKVPEVFKEAKGAVKDVVEDVKDGITSLFD